MDINTHLILIRNEDKTREIHSCNYQKGKWHIQFKGNNKVYPYNYPNVDWYRNPIRIDPRTNIVYESNQPITGIANILQFDNHIRLIFNSNFAKTYHKSAITIETTSLHNYNEQNTFNYLTALANNVNEITDEEPSFLGKVYKNITQISPRSVLSNYLSGIAPKSKKSERDLIYPFGFNGSQKTATEKAFSNQLSIIEGPPGTGKTQTILNIIANAIINNESVAVASNNNSATNNVLEKLEQYGFDFFAAYLGNKENQETFFQNQTDTYPNMSDWNVDNEKISSIKSQLKDSQIELNDMLDDKNRQAKLKQTCRNIVRIR